MQKSLAALLDALKAYHPQKIILFGSAARGEADAESDLDLLVIKETREPFVERLEVMAGVSAFPMRVKCATLAWHAMKSALDGKGKAVME